MSHPELNIPRISEKVSDIKKTLLLLKDYGRRDDKSFLENEEAIRAARYSLIVLIEAATNIANHLCSRLLSKVPATYADTFLSLGEEEILDIKLSRNLAQMARFRNLLVHGYGEVDDQRMLKIIREDLTDVEGFLQQVAEIVSADR